MTVLDISQITEVKVGLPVHVVDTEGDFGVCTGETLDLGLSGLRARLREPLPSTCETTVQVELPDGYEVVTSAIVAECAIDDDGWMIYRLVFADLWMDDLQAIRSLLTA